VLLDTGVFSQDLFIEECMKREQNEELDEMYLRIRLQRALAGQSTFLDKYAPLDWDRAEALLLIPPWMYPSEHRDLYNQELQSLERYEYDIVQEAEKKRVIEPNRWSEAESQQKLLFICSLARFHELFESSLVESYLGAVQLAFIDGNTNPVIKEHIEELLWDLDWDAGAVYEILEDIQNNIGLAEENIDWSKDIDVLSKKMEEALLPRTKWYSWLTEAREDLVLFLNKLLQPRQVFAMAASSLPKPKPLPTFVLWRESQAELSITYYQDQPFVQFYGHTIPELQMGDHKLTAVSVPTEFQSDKLHWWNLPRDFCSTLSIVFEDKEVTVSLVQS
jgi:hypothetical protein